MKKGAVIFSAVALQAALSLAQTDSAQIANANWKQEQIYAGVFYGFNHFNNLFTSAQSISVIDVNLNTAPVKISFPYTSGRKLTSEMALGAGAVAAVNGTYFNVNSGGSIEYLKVNGGFISPTNDTTYDFRDDAALSILANASAEITRIPSNNSWSAYSSNAAYANVMAAGPLLLYAGSPIAYANVVFNTGRNPRTVACLTADGHLKLSAIDGRTTMAAGMTIPELQTLAKGLGCRDALNYDGGGSTTMWISGKPNSGVVNYPSDNGVYDHLGERTVANAIAIVPTSASGLRLKSNGRIRPYAKPENGMDRLQHAGYIFYDARGKTLREREFKPYRANLFPEMLHPLEKSGNN